MKFLLAFILILSSSLSEAQSLKKLIEIGDQYNEDGDYYGASLEYAKAVAIDSIDIHLLFKYAESLRKYNNHELAAHYYQKIYGKDRGRIYPIGVFWLAEMQKHNQDYRNALKSWKKATSLFKKDKKSYEYMRSRHEGLSTSWAMRAIKDSAQDVVVANLGEGVNTSNWEFSAVKFHEQLVFSSLRSENIGPNLQVLDKDYHVHIYQASYAENSWLESKKMNASFNSANYNTAAGTFSKDGLRFYFVQAGNDYKSAIYIAHYDNNKWSEATKLTGDINGDFIATQPFLFELNEKEYLLFSSNRPGGQGKLDLYYAPLQTESQTGKVINLGKQVNSPDDEVTPYYNSQLNTLFFSSKWHKNLGGFDVFKSIGPIDKLSQPLNMGQPVNSSWNDFYFSADDNGRGFMTSNRIGSIFEKGPTCCNDIWSVLLPTEQRKTEEIVIETLDDLNKYLPVTLYFHNDCPNPRTTDTITALNYITTYNDYHDLMPTYKVEYSAGLNEEKSIEAQLDIEDFFNDFVDKGVEDLALFTKLLLTELEKGQNIELTIKGFASPLAKTDYNVKLTGRRITSLMNYLREYNTGEFNEYIDATAENGGTLSFNKIPFGEYTASNLVSDNVNDQKNSVYSRAAGLERKIEIQSITQAKRDSIYAEIACSQALYDFGSVTEGDKVSHEFVIHNSGTKPLEIEKVVTRCGCSVAEYNQEPIAPGASTKIKITIDTKGMAGKQVKSVTVVANSFPRNKRLVLTAEVLKK
ncbi:DUF1573 domain-containing protein [Flavobacteriales bacterium]|nr:DUF1573 domain-containing protein [Flavobacteriales bacterium]